MTRPELVQKIFQRKTYLCVGLDTDRKKIPGHLQAESDPLFLFNKAIIDATRTHCVAYKINTAFYEAAGSKGWAALEKTIDYIGDSHFTIADAKRGDIGNTADQYAKAFFENMPFDAITLHPYMGEDSITPFLQFPGKWAILLGLTSNPGAADFELQQCGNKLLYEKVLEAGSRWGNPSNLMFVVGATRPDEIANIRTQTPDHFYLVPGVGAQGGSLAAISEKGMTKECGLLVNASRAIIYADSGKGFATAAEKAALHYKQEMSGYLDRY